MRWGGRWRDNGIGPVCAAARRAKGSRMAAERLRPNLHEQRAGVIGMKAIVRAGISDARLCFRANRTRRRATGQLGMLSREFDHHRAVISLSMRGDHRCRQSANAGPDACRGTPLDRPQPELSSWAFSRLAWYAFILANFTEAIGSLRRSLRLNSNDPQAGSF
jgi:hypothetical protein